MPNHEDELLVERHSPLAFNETVKRLSQAVTDAGMRCISARQTL